MRAVLSLLLTALLVIPLAGATYSSRTDSWNFHCIAATPVIVFGCGIGPACYPTSESAGTFRLTVTWDAVAAGYTEFNVTLFTAHVDRTPGTYTVAQHFTNAQSTGPSALVLTVPATTDSAATDICFKINPSSPIFTNPLTSQPLTTQLEHLD